MLTLPGLRSPGGQAAFSPDGERLALCWGPNGTGPSPLCQVWDVTAGQRLLALSWPATRPLCLAFGPDGKHLAVGVGDQTIRLHDSSTGQELAVWRGHRAAVRWLTFSPDGRRLASADADGLNKVWDVRTGQDLLTLSRGVVALAFSPDGHRLAGYQGAGAFSPPLHLWDASPVDSR